MTRFPRMVVTGPPGSGKSTWVKQQAQFGDLVWDLDDIASVMAYHGQMPPQLKGKLPYPVMKATLRMRDALIEWLAAAEPRCGIYIIVTDPQDAQAIARQLHATIQTMAAFAGAAC